LSALIREAATLSLKHVLDAKDKGLQYTVEDIEVKMEHFEQAFNSVRPSVSDHDRRRYETLRSVFEVAR